MVHFFICPQCRSEHAEPAEAHFLLAVLCVDCVMAIDYADSRIETVERFPAAA